MQAAVLCAYEKILAIISVSNSAPSNAISASSLCGGVRALSSA